MQCDVLVSPNPAKSRIFTVYFLWDGRCQPFNTLIKLVGFFSRELLTGVVPCDIPYLFRHAVPPSKSLVTTRADRASRIFDQAI